MIYLLLIFIVLFALELFYFKLADRFNIIDKPNERSSHSAITLRGGGIIFPVAWLLYFFISGFQYPLFTAGLVLISAISFWDDIRSLSNRIRITTHVLAITFCFYELGLFDILPWWALIILYIVCIGCLNAINFMDGINGMTGLYAISVLLSLPFIYTQFNNLAHINPVYYILLSLLVFGFFNFRKKAKCFAGDVGSISIAYFLIFIILCLMFKLLNPETGHIEMHPAKPSFEPKYILLLAVYGVDVILTILHRILLKENIFNAHRRHLYQYLANELHWPHLAVAGLYAALQFGINFWIINCHITLLQGTILILILSAVYILVKQNILRTIS